MRILGNDDRKINIAVVGCGSRAKGLMGLLRRDAFTIVAVCDLLDARLSEAKAIVGNPDVKTTKDFKTLLDDKSIEAVLIATPLFEHFRIAREFILAGKHVYLEKTMTYNIAQAQELMKLVKAHPKQVLQVGHQFRYYPLYIKAREMVQQGYVGKVTHINCRYDRNGSWRREVTDPKLERQINWRMYKEYSGGLAAEILSHQIDFTNWVFDTHPDEIIATGGIDFYKDGRETDDNFDAVLRYNKAGFIGSFGATCANDYEGFSIKIKGNKGTILLIMDDGFFYPQKEAAKTYQTVDGVTGATKLSWNTDGGIKIWPDKLRDPSYYAIRGFYKSIVEKKTPTSNVVSGATSAICVHMANKAREAGALEKWKDDYLLA